MSFITDPIESALAPAGGNAAKSQGKRQSAVAKQYGGLFNVAAPQFNDLLMNLQNQDLGRTIGAATNAINQDPSQRINKFQSGATERASTEATATANFNRSQGYGDGATAGAAQGLFQDAARQTNAFAAQQSDPDEQLKRLLALIQAFSGSTGAYGNLLNMLASGVYGQPQVQVQANPLAGVLGQAAGAYTSGLASAAGKKAGA